MSSPGAESVMTLSGLEFSFASPVPETLRQTSNDEISTSLILSHIEEPNEQNEQETSTDKDEREADNSLTIQPLETKEQEPEDVYTIEARMQKQREEEKARMQEQREEETARKCKEEGRCEIHTKEMLERGRKQMLSNLDRFEHNPWWRKEKLKYEPQGFPYWYRREKEKEIANCENCAKYLLNQTALLEARLGTKLL